MSEIRVDKISGKTSANAVTVTGENGSTQTSLQQGLCKAWVNFDGAVTTSAEDTTGERDSFNIGSLVDGGTGHTTINFTTGFENTGYAATNLVEYTIDGTLNAMIISIMSMSQTALEIKTHWNATVYDSDYVGISVHGDLT